MAAGGDVDGAPSAGAAGAGGVEVDDVDLVVEHDVAVERVGEAPTPEVATVSRLDGPIADLDLMRRALLFAEVSMVAYLPDDQALPAFAELGFDHAVLVERDGAQAYVLTDATDRVVACRGTEPTDWNDLRADANAFTVVAETVGRVHRGFKTEVDDVWPHVRDELGDAGHATWFTGHSLGAAMATIMASRCTLEDVPVVPVELQTYGSPRVGTRRYVRHARLTHHRWVNNNDLVTRVPPPFMGYHHVGSRMYLDSDGRHRRVTAQELAADRAKGFREALLGGRLDQFADHAIAAYVAHLQANVAAGIRAAPPRRALDRVGALAAGPRRRLAR